MELELGGSVESAHGAGYLLGAAAVLPVCAETNGQGTHCPM